MKKGIFALSVFCAAVISILVSARTGKAGIMLVPITNTYPFEESFSHIVVNCSECDVELIPSDETVARVVCKEAEQIHHTVRIEDDALKIDRDPSDNIVLSFGFDVELKVEIYLPAGEYKDLSIATSSGDIEIPKDFSFDSMSLSSSSGDMECAASARGGIQAESSSGDLEFEGASSESLTAHSSSGEISLSGVRCTQIELKASSGDIELEDVIAEGELEIGTSSGDIEVKKSDAGSVRIESTSGDVKGSFLSGKEFVTKTTSGDSKVPDASDGGRCEIRTTSGDIRITVGS